jgi:RNA polymerase sigma factor (TIGR02999 family)
MARVARTLSAPLTELLVTWGQGDQRALHELTPVVYGELRRLAQWHMTRERPGATLQATALVNEAYMRLVGIHQLRWQDRTHFFAMAARQMRRVSIDAARQRRSQKRGAGIQKVSLAAGLAIHDRPRI